MNTSNRENAKKRLLGQFPLEKTGIWEIRGEDDNADFGGHHYQQLLGYFEGRYGDIVDFALNLKGFFAWGYGGDIKEVKVVKVDTSKTKQLAEAKAELEELEKRKKELEAKVTWLIVGGA